jgi:hypothetical protein
MLFHEHTITNISEKYSPLCIDVFPELLRIFLNFYIPWHTMKDSEVPLKNCLLIHICSFSQLRFILNGLVVRVFASNTGGQRIETPWTTPFFMSQLNLGIFRNSEQLTSVHFLLYNYRSSTLRRISRNIGRLLRQCEYIQYIRNKETNTVPELYRI